MKKEEKKQPELRFKGFTDDWIQKKISDCMVLQKSYPFTRSSETEENTGIKYIHYGDIHTGVANVIDDDNVLPNICYGEYLRLKKGDIVLADASEDYQGIAWPAIINKDFKNAIVAGLHTVALSPSQGDPLFFYYHFLSPTFRQYGYKVGTGMKVFGISSKKVLEYRFCLPAKEEQAKISFTLSKLDSIITLEQEKLEKLKKVKEYLLQQMFANESGYPKLRFKGFVGEWIQRRLREISNRVTRKNKGASGIPLTISDKFGLIDQREYFGRKIASNDISNYLLLKKGEFAYNRSYSANSLFGTVARLENYPNGALSTLYIAFEINGVAEIFVKQYYKSKKWHKELYKIAAEGARNHGLLNVNASDFFSTKLIIPNSPKEQIKIGNALENIDSIIILSQAKLDNLLSVKQKLLQSLFV